MTQSRMAQILVFGSLACALVLATASTNAMAAALAPPDGAYKYSVTRGGASVGSTVVTVKRAAPSITIHEAEAFGGVTETVDMITNRIYAVVGTMRTVHDDVDAADPSTADLLHAIIDDLEKEAWLLKSENGKA